MLTLIVITKIIQKVIELHQSILNNNKTSRILIEVSKFIYNLFCFFFTTKFINSFSLFIVTQSIDEKSN